MRKIARALTVFMVVVAALAPFDRQLASAGGELRLAAASSMASTALAALPTEARETLALIKRGGPFPYRRDGAVFGNFERRLPLRPRGYYREYTVPTPGLKSRGARRIIRGAEGEYYYTDDHYVSFTRIQN